MIGPPLQGLQFNIEIMGTFGQIPESDANHLKISCCAMLIDWDNKMAYCPQKFPDKKGTP